MPPVPRTLADLTPAWFTQALGVEVRAVSAAPGLRGTAITAIVHRLALQSDGPASVVVKPAAEGRGRGSGLYAREVRFYREVGARCAQTSREGRSVIDCLFLSSRRA